MARYRFTNAADQDLEDLYEYGIRKFGLQQAQLYLQTLEDRLQRLTDHPLSGSSADELASGMRRCPHGQHVVFYVPDDLGILVVRILRMEMDFARHVRET